MYKAKTGETAYDITMVMNGTLAGLVGVTAGCAMFEPWAAFVVGGVSGWVYIFVSKMLVSLKIDDAVDAIPVHMGAGLWGVIAVGIFAEPDLVAGAVSGNGGAGLIYGGKSALIIAQLTGAAWIIGWVSAVMIPFFLFLKFAGLLRVSNIDEEVGLDISHHKGMAYTLDGPTDESINKYEIHKSQRRLEIPTDIEQEVAEKTSNGVPSSEADFNAFVNAVKNK
jgi:Amt family ammonium transporter